MPRLETGSLFEPIVINVGGQDYTLPPLTCEIMEAFDAADVLLEGEKPGSFGKYARQLVVLGIPLEATSKLDVREIARIHAFIAEQFNTPDKSKNA